MTETAATPVAFELAPEHRRFRWQHLEASAASYVPLTASLTDIERGEPGEGDDCVPRIVGVNGYQYSRVRPLPTPQPIPFSEAADWRARALPRVEATVRAMEFFDVALIPPGNRGARLRELAAEWWPTFLDLHARSIAPARNAATAFVEDFVRAYGETRREDAHALLRGFPNSSSQRANALWALSRAVRRSPSLRASLERGDFEATAEHEDFWRAFRAMVDVYGETTLQRMEDQPTWSEHPARPVSLILTYADQPDENDPARHDSAHQQRRLELEVELRQAVASDEAARRLLDQLPLAQLVTPVTEDHNLLGDQPLFAGRRRLWLRLGQHLMDVGLLDAPDDVFYCEFDELCALLDGAELRPPIEARRAQQVAWRAASPPAFLGAADRATEEETAPVAEQIKGRGASTGVYTGRARVITAIEDARRLESGDILVCPVTSPEWTPYFAVVSALVTNTGGVLSHGAIVAREFGIPAVIGTRDATERVRDGQLIRVDGTAGTVDLLGDE